MTAPSSVQLAALSGPELEGSAAREAAQAKIRRFKRQSAKIDEVTATGCRPVTRHRFLCFYHASGETRTRATTCRLRVTVRGSGFAVASVGMRIACSSRPILSVSRAKTAMLTKLESFTGRSVPLMALERQAHGRFLGYSEWIQESGPAAEECFAELAATLSATGTFWLSTEGPQCRVVGAPAPGNVFFRQYIEPQPEVEPSALGIGTGTLGGTFNTSDLAWRGWGAGWTVATGRVEFRGCSPTCVQGKLFDLAATVVLDKVESRCGQRRYGRIRILPKGGPYPIIGPYGVDCDGLLIF